MLGDGDFAMQEIILTLIEGSPLDDKLQKVWDSDHFKQVRQCLG